MVQGPAGLRLAERVERSEEEPQGARQVGSLWSSVDAARVEG